MNKKFYSLFLISTIILSAFLRIWNIDINPKGFFCDEASIGYNAYSLLTTGRDEWGKSWPLFIKAFGEYKGPIMTYSTIPTIVLLGLSIFSVRIVSSIYGVLAVIAFYFLGKTIKNEKLGIICAFFLAISPWHIHFSRTSLEGLTPMIFFLIMGINFWLKYWKRADIKNMALSIIFLGLSLYSYFPARITIPLLAIFLLLFDMKKIFMNRKIVFIGSILTALLIAPLFIHTVFGPGLARWQQVHEKQPLTKTLTLYKNHFSANFLFFKGDIDFPGQFVTRHSVRGIGQLYSFQLPLIILGLFLTIKMIKKRENKIIICLLFIYPLGTTLTNVSGPQATRSFVGVIPFTLLSAIGFEKLLTFVSKTKTNIVKRTLQSLIPLIIIFSIFRYANLVDKYPTYSAGYWGWQSGFETIYKDFLKQQNNYDQLMITHRFNMGEELLQFFQVKNSCVKCIIAPNPITVPKGKKILIGVRKEGLLEIQKQTSKYKVIKIIEQNKKPELYVLEINS